jgi:LysM repeat protein
VNPYGIQVRQPLAGDLIGNKLTIAAIGTAFEASYGWRLVHDGATLAEDYFTAGSMGSMEPFVYETPITLDHSGPATLRVFGDDPSGNSEGTDLVEVPVVVLAGVTGYVPHQVSAGDTLTRIAAEYNSTLDRIALANNLSNPDMIRVGQLLRVPV